MLASQQLYTLEMALYLEAFKFYAKIQQCFCKQIANLLHKQVLCNKSKPTSWLVFIIQGPNLKLRKQETLLPLHSVSEAHKMGVSVASPGGALS